MDHHYSVISFQSNHDFLVDFTQLKLIFYYPKPSTNILSIIFFVRIPSILNFDMQHPYFYFYI